jgi:hypothetical protein
MMSSVVVPAPGQLVEVRHRRYVVIDIVPPTRCARSMYTFMIAPYTELPVTPVCSPSQPHVKLATATWTAAS